MFIKHGEFVLDTKAKAAYVNRQSQANTSFDGTSLAIRYTREKQKIAIAGDSCTYSNV